MKRLIVLLLQAALVAAIVGGTYLYTESRTKPTGVIVFGQDIPRHTKITENMLTVVTVPESAISRAMTMDMRAVVDKYTGSDVVKGEPVFIAKILDEKSLAPEFMMKGDIRKQSFEVDLAGSNGGALKPGDHIDLIYYMEDSAANTARSDIFVRRIRVLDVRNSEAVPLNNPGKETGAGGFDSGTGKRVPAVITVAVTPDQAKQIVFYKNRGKIDIAVYPENADGAEPAPAAVGQAPGKAVTATVAPKTAAAAPTVPAVAGKTTPDYRYAPNMPLPEKIENGRNR